MTSFVVLHKDGAPARFSERTVFVRDRFSIAALAFPFFWLIWHRLWFASLLFFCVIAVLVFAAGDHRYFFAFGPLNILAGCFVALEGPAWRISAYRYAGYRQIGVVSAENLEQAELAFALRGAAEDASDTQKTPQTPVRPSAIKAGSGTHDLIFGGNN